jgi:hypothetical protein
MIPALTSKELSPTTTRICPTPGQRLLDRGARAVRAEINTTSLGCG